MKFIVFIFSLLIVLSLSEDDGNRKIRELRELSEKSPNRIIKIDGKEFK